MRMKLICLIVICVILASCSSIKNFTATNSEKQVVSVSWWGAEARNKATIEAFTEYKKVNTDIEFEYITLNYTGYLDEINKRFLANNAPDIISLDAPWVATADTQNERFVDLINYCDVIDLTGFDRYLLRDYCEYNGKLVMVPLGINASSIIIDKKLKNDFGINIDAKMTWDKIIEDGKKINAISPEHYYINTNLDNLYQCIFKPYLSQLCGNTLMKDDNTPNFTKQQLQLTFEYIVALYKNNVLQPLQESEKYASIYDNPKWNDGSLHASFDWTSAMIASGNQQFNDNYLLTTIPVLSNANNTAIIVRPTGGFAINTNSKNIRVCAEALDFFVNDPKAVNAAGTVRSIPANDNAQDILQANKIITPQLIEVIESSILKKGVPENPQSQLEKTKALFRNALKDVALGTLTPKATSEKYYEQLKNN